MENSTFDFSHVKEGFDIIRFDSTRELFTCEFRISVLVSVNLEIPVLGKVTFWREPYHLQNVF